MNRCGLLSGKSPLGAVMKEVLLADIHMIFQLYDAFQDIRAVWG